MAEPDTVYIVPGTGTIIMERTPDGLRVTPHSLDSAQRAIGRIIESVNPRISYEFVDRPVDLDDSTHARNKDLCEVAEAAANAARNTDALCVEIIWGSSKLGKLAEALDARMKLEPQADSRELAASIGITAANNPLFDAAGRFVPGLESAQEAIQNIYATTAFGIDKQFGMMYAGVNGGEILPLIGLQKFTVPGSDRLFVNKNRTPLGSYGEFSLLRASNPEFVPYSPSTVDKMPGRNESNRAYLYADKRNGTNILSMNEQSDLPLLSLRSMDGVIIEGGKEGEAAEWFVDMVVQNLLPSGYRPDMQVDSKLKAGVMCSGSQFLDGVVDPKYASVKEGLDKGLWNAVDMSVDRADQRLTYLVMAVNHSPDPSKFTYADLQRLFLSGSRPERIVEYDSEGINIRRPDSEDRERRRITTSLLGSEIPEDLLHLRTIESALTYLETGNYAPSNGRAKA